MHTGMGTPEAGVLLQNAWGGKPDPSGGKQALHHLFSWLCGKRHLTRPVAEPQPGTSDPIQGSEDT